ncbi:MAG: tRNA uridine-5-carboxymethylaminomethyl(34) synthesis GTPase MnmE [Bacteroidota bacterium]
MPPAVDPKRPAPIAAIATARGQAALAIVRVSGPEAVRIVDARFSKRLGNADSHTVHVGYVLDAEGADNEARRLDQVVVTLFRAPRSATGEDVVEVTCHGGDVAPALVLRSLLDAGARLAEPGEFTQRAFLNGKLDLAQAEAVADLIHAQSHLAHRVSLHQLQGRTSVALQQIRQELIQTKALIELELDFVEEDVEFADRDELRRLLSEAARLLSDLLDTARLGAYVRDGVRVVIGGRPNAGKSTLLNALVERDRAIVSPVAGTTRDEIEAEREIGGLRFRFVDTAGLRETADLIEAEGVRRTHRSIDAADVLVYVYDATTGLDDEEIAFLDTLAAERPRLPVLRVANKADLLAPPVSGDSRSAPASPETVPLETEGDKLSEARSGGESGAAPLLLSAEHATADPSRLGSLRAALLAAVADDLSEADSSPVVVNERHRQHLAAALQAVQAAQRALDLGISGDTLSLDLREALHELGAITGEITSDDVLGAIFSQFCIGK